MCGGGALHPSATHGPVQRGGAAEMFGYHTPPTGAERLLPGCGGHTGSELLVLWSCGPALPNHTSYYAAKYRRHWG